MASGLGFFAGGLSDSLNAGFSRNQQADFQQKELQIQQQGQQMAQQRFDLGRVDTAVADLGSHIQQTIDAGKIAGEDPKTIMSAVGGMFDQYRRLTTSAGRGSGFADAQLAAWMASPPSTELEKAHAAAKESPSLAALRKSQTDPWGLGGGSGAGTVAPPGSNTFQPGEEITGIDVQEQPPTRVAQETPAPSSDDPEGKGAAYLSTLGNPRLAEAVKAVADYRINPTTMLARMPSAQRTQFLGMVQQYAAARGQVWDQVNFSTKSKAMTGFAQRVQALSLADSELTKVLPILRKSSNAVDRTEYSDINSIIEAAQKHTGGQAVVQFGENLNSVINLYARAINPTGGKPTVNDLKNAEGILQEAWSKGQIEAGIQNMLEVIEATKASLPAARNEILGILSGEQSKPSKSQPPQYKFNPQTGELE